MTQIPRFTGNATEFTRGNRMLALGCYHIVSCFSKAIGGEEVGGGVAVQGGF